MTFARWKKAFLLRVFYPLLARMPKKPAYALASLLGRFDGRFDQDLRIAVGNGLRQAWPELPAPLLEARLREYAGMRAHEIMDAFWLPRMSSRDLQQLVRMDGVAELQAAQAEGKGVLLLMAHYSRLIMLLAALGDQGVRIGMLTIRIDEDNPDLIPAERRYLKNKVAALRGRINGGWVALGDSLRPLYAGLKRGEVWVVLFDAYTPDFDGWRNFDFLDRAIRLPHGVERILAGTGAQAMYASVREEGALALSGRIQPLPREPVLAFQQAVAELEKDVLRQPAQWWQWNIFEYLRRAEAGDLVTSPINKK